MALARKVVNKARFLPPGAVEVMRRFTARMGGMVLLLAAGVMILALVTADSRDPSFNTAVDRPAQNVLGRFGAIVADVLTQVLGAAAWLGVVVITVWGIKAVLRSRMPTAWGGRWFLMLLGMVAASIAFAGSSLPGGGGALGKILATILAGFIPTNGPMIVTLAAGGIGGIALLFSLGLSSTDWTEKNPKPEPPEKPVSQPKPIEVSKIPSPLSPRRKPGRSPDLPQHSSPSLFAAMLEWLAGFRRKAASDTARDREEAPRLSSPRGLRNLDGPLSPPPAGAGRREPSLGRRQDPPPEEEDSPPLMVTLPELQRERPGLHRERIVEPPPLPAAPPLWTAEEFEDSDPTPSWETEQVPLPPIITPPSPIVPPSWAVGGGQRPPLMPQAWAAQREKNLADAEDRKRSLQAGPRPPYMPPSRVAESMRTPAVPEPSPPVRVEPQLPVFHAPEPAPSPPPPVVEPPPPPVFQHFEPVPPPPPPVVEPPAPPVFQHFEPVPQPPPPVVEPPAPPVFQRFEPVPPPPPPVVEPPPPPVFQRFGPPVQQPPPPVVEPPPPVSQRPVPPPIHALPDLLEEEEDEYRDYALPPLSLLMLPPEKGESCITQESLGQNAEKLESVLKDFGVQGKIVNAHPGPVVTLYELEPAPGTKTSRVIGLAEDIARSMSALSVRIATVPGRSVIGIELPNPRRETVYLRESLSDEAFEMAPARLTLALGKDIGGSPVIADLAKMPHLLVAGATGTGKSVGINAMILSLLYRLTPEECRLIMIDPKMVELSVYDGIPHLLAPVVTEPTKAVVALKWAVREMEDRYRAMSQLGVRNISNYNQKILEAGERGQSLTRTVQTGFDPENGKPVYEEQVLDMNPFPFIVVIVDEVADLMQVAGKDVEAAVQRLAQMARAAGIHLIIATQRPSVDVITGTIKANFPSRISFLTRSKIDSRTILDEQGAEQLLGNGDMLYMPSGGRLTRIHGPFVSDREVEKVVEHWRSQGEPCYLEAVTAEEETAPAGGAGGAGSAAGDELYDQAVAIVAREGKASTSFIQRHLQIGYNRAARLIERMEAEGVVGKPNHVGKREILVRSTRDD